MQGSSVRLVSSATIAPNIIRYLLRVADEHGVSLDRAIHDAGLSRETLDAPGLRVSYRQGRVIIEAALDRLPGPALGLEVGARQPITASGVLGLAMMSSPTIADAVDIGVRYQNLAGSMMRWSTVREGDLLVVVTIVLDDAAPVDRFLVEEGFANITRMVRESADATIRPVRVEFARPEPADPARFQAFFDAPVVFGGPRNAWLLRSQQWRRALDTWDPWTLADATTLLAVAAEQTVDRQELVAALSAQVEAALPDVRPLGAHARMLAMSERTLRRRLADVDASYSDVLDEVRRRLTARLITRADLSFADIAAEIGYTDDRSLRRAVKRWFGIAPGDLRQRAIGE
ncbi:AraC family transcriptional regulator [Nocardia sp. CA-119907]|uniref:AraC family transcriptional regulator n=1 Tax=Nocardia sp. CA-119907 TaxID=3239973 RepID=UPI003D9A08E6